MLLRVLLAAAMLLNQVEAKQLLAEFESHRLQHLLRHHNKHADRLANEAMDQQDSWETNHTDTDQPFGRVDSRANEPHGVEVDIVSPVMEPDASDPVDSVVDAVVVAPGTLEPWQCDKCTYMHETEKEMLFLACDICGAPRV